jgi:proline iminopeptidase
MVYLDERGSGASERSAAGGYTLATMAGDIEGLRKALGTARVVPMGHSFGAALAATYAQTYPEHTAAVILVDGAVDMPAAMATWVRTLKEGFPKLYAAEWNKAAGKVLAAVDPKDTCALTKARLAFVGDALAEPADNEAFHHLQQFHNPKTLDEQTRIDKEGGFTNTGEAASALLSPSGGFLCYRAKPASLTMPTLVLVGTYDRAVGVEAQRVLARQAPHATYVEFANSAHFPYEEEPGPFSAAVFSFLDSHGIDSPNSQPAPHR